MEYKDYYKLMGLARDASQEDIKRAYRRLARKYHPDVSKEVDAEVRFKEIGEAYEVLKDPEKRAAYDQLGSNWRAGQEFHPPPEWDAGFEFKGAGVEGMDAASFSDFFESLFGRGFRNETRSHGKRQHEIRGEDHHAKVLIDIEDSYTGANKAINLRSPEYNDQGHVQIKEKSLKVRIPRGVSQGQKIRLAGQGGRGLGDGKRGDLFLDIEFKPHPIFRVDKRDLYMEVPLAPWEVALGAKIKVPTPGGTVELSVPENTQSGSRLRLKGRGIPGNPAGDIYVITKTVLPDAGTDKSREFYEKMKQDMAFNPRKNLGVST